MGDIEDVCAVTGWRFLGSLLDVGCGTGRMARYTDDYRGVDIAPAMVEYCREAGLDVTLTDDPSDLPVGPFDQGVMLSVMTHIDRKTRRAYLTALRSRVSSLLVDILPGRDDGSFGETTADPDNFAADVAEAGFEIVTTYERQSRDGHNHRYYVLTWAD